MVRTSSSRPARSLFLASGLLAALYGAGSGFTMWTGMSRKQRRGMLHNKERLYPSNAIEVEEPEEEVVVEKFVMPEHRIPYAIHLAAEHFPEGENPNMKYVERKIKHALENYESFVFRVEAHMMYEGKHKVHGKEDSEATEIVDEETESATLEQPKHMGEVMAPYFLKVKVHMRSHRSFVISRPALHARHTFTEAVDHTIDVMKKGLREEKDKTIKTARKMRREGKQNAAEESTDDFKEDPVMALALEKERTEALADKQRDELYRAVEAAGDKAEQEEAKKAARAVSRAAKKAKAAPVAEKKEAAETEKSGDLLSGVMGMFGL